MKNSGSTAPQELETFLPGDAINGKTKYKIVPAKADPENASTEFNPFAERKNAHPVTDMETFTHLLKASLGTGILAMPAAFKYSGLVGTIFSTILTAFICTHCSYVLVKCAHTLYKRTRTTTMNFSEVAEVACSQGPKWGRKFSKLAKYSILINLFITYFGTCSVYTVIIATNFKQIVDFHTGQEYELRLIIAALIVPLILLSWVPNLKYLAPFSMLANCFMGIGLSITFYYCVIDMHPLNELPHSNSIFTYPPSIAIVIFAMEAIGVVMPLENQMKTPENFVGSFGVLNRGMFCVTIVYIIVGFFGYARYGEETQGSITLNLPIEEVKAQAVKILIALAVFFTYGLQFYVCIEIAWNGIKDSFTKRPMVVNYVMRTVLVAASVLLAVAVPTISPFIGLIGAFCFSILGLLIPVFIETVTYWDEGFGKFNWVIIKNVFISFFGILALVFGSKSAIEEIIDMYTE